MSLRRLTTQPE